VGAVLGEKRLNLPLEVGAGGPGRGNGDKHADHRGEGTGCWAFERMHGEILGTVNIGKSRTNDR
jgi:hypothetical protein